MLRRDQRHGFGIEQEPALDGFFGRNHRFRIRQGRQYRLILSGGRVLSDKPGCGKCIVRSRRQRRYHPGYRCQYYTQTAEQFSQPCPHRVLVFTWFFTGAGCPCHSGSTRHSRESGNPCPSASHRVSSVERSLFHRLVDREQRDTLFAGDPHAVVIFR